MYDTIRKYCDWRFINRRPDRSPQCSNYNTYNKYATNDDYSIDNYYPAEYTDSYFVTS